MKYSSTILLAASGLVSALTQQCSTSSGVGTDENGNWFCGKVDNILYQYGSDASSGSYMDVSAMDNGVCTDDTAHPFSGGVAPFDEELSIHVRGPVQLKEFAVFTMGSSSSKRDAASPHVKPRDGKHRHLHRRDTKMRRADMVTATINGQVDVWTNNYNPGSPATAAVQDDVLQTTAPVVQSVQTEAPAASTAAPAAESTVSTTSDLSSGDDSGTSNVTSSGAWSRTSYYNAESQTADNIVFLGNFGADPGGFSQAELAFANSDGTAGASSSQIFNDALLGSSKEIAIFTGDKCDSDCGFIRSGAEGYKGFSGGNKIFLFRFSMPHSTAGDSAAKDMPAIWALNARIPRAMQYGSCSCWESGCGEFDIFEVLATGDTKAKSTIHLANNKGGGSSDYFDRPTGGYINVAAIVSEEATSLAVRTLDDSFDFGDADSVKALVSELSDNSSLFQMS